MTRAVIFDLYGTLLYLVQNSQPYLRLLEELQWPRLLAGVQQAFIADAADLAAFCRHLQRDPPAGIERWEAALAADLESAELFADTMPVLDTLRTNGLRIGVISNLATPYKLPFVTLGLADRVDATVFSCDLGIAKPQPEIYQTALEQLGVSAAETLMVGDSLRSDVHGPAELGIRGLLLDRAGSAEHRPRISSLAELHLHL